MVKKRTLRFIEVTSPITQPVTKFGGQPVWLEAPQWPISRSTGEPMRFLCQIALDEEIFGELAGRMTYLFISDGPTFVDNTYDPEGGENALIIQPGGTYAEATLALATGPALEKWVTDAAIQRRAPFPAEYAVDLISGDDPDVYPDDSFDTMEENKVGGVPAFLQGDEIPTGGPWRLLLQLDSGDVPFEVNFGDAGIGYGFISDDGLTGKFLWQCA